MLVGKTKTDIIANAPWMKRTSLPNAYSLFPWQEITPAERIALEQQSWMPPTLLPFKYERNLEPATNLLQVFCK